MQELDPLLHSQLRLAIMSILLSVEEADFVYLKEKTESTAENTTSAGNGMIADHAVFVVFRGAWKPREYRLQRTLRFFLQGQGRSVENHGFFWYNRSHTTGFMRNPGGRRRGNALY